MRSDVNAFVANVVANCVEKAHDKARDKGRWAHHVYH